MTCLGKLVGIVAVIEGDFRSLLMICQLVTGLGGIILNKGDEMGVKSTETITRDQALDILLGEIPTLPNDALGELMDALADCGHSKIVSKYNNFIVSQINSRDVDHDDVDW
jgi:hypothetical protein